MIIINKLFFYNECIARKTIGIIVILTEYIWLKIIWLNSTKCNSLNEKILVDSTKPHISCSSIISLYVYFFSHCVYLCIKSTEYFGVYIDIHIGKKAKKCPLACSDESLNCSGRRAKGGRWLLMPLLGFSTARKPIYCLS